MRGRSSAAPLLAMLAWLALDAARAWADHPVGLRSEGWSPMTTALVFGGLALLAGMLVIVIVSLLTRRRDGSS